VGSPLYMSP
jgi:serine/threonine protein kinase